MALPTYQLGDTIVALATAQGVGAIGVIRLSGPKAITIVDSVFPAKDLQKQATHTVHFGTIRRADNSIVDEVLATLFVGPKSYTGEHVVEVSCHGSDYIIQELIQLFISQGARLAQPGEFTMRAFLNGQLDLSQAEAVADLIASSSAGSHELAMKQMRGGFSNEIAALRQQLVDFASLIELELDFGEEDVEFANREDLRRLVEKIQGILRQLIQSFQLGNVIKQGVSTVIAGRPNAGKSTLLNALLNEERAIVSDIAGTTRDTIEEILNIGGVQFRLIDTAGIREAEDTIEAIGVEKTMEKVRQSSLLVYVFDVIETPPEEVRSDLAKLQQPGMHILVVANKMDLNPYTTFEQYFDSSPSPSTGGGELGRTGSPSEYLGKWMTTDPQTFKKLQARARELRKNPTEAEAALWPHIRRRNIEDSEFRRQHIIGQFIPDFVNLEHKLILEIDGGYHQLPEVKIRDEERTKVLEAMGYQVLRFSNDHVLSNVQAVIDEIAATLQKLKAPTDNLPSSGGGGQRVEYKHWVPIIAREGMNIPYLKEKLYEAVITEQVNTESTIVSNARHAEALDRAYAALDAVLKGMADGVTSDFVAMDIRQALYHLGTITGEVSTDELLGNIFSRFCIGK